MELREYLLILVYAVNGLIGYLFEIPEDGQFKSVENHNFLKEYRRSQVEETCDIERDCKWEECWTEKLFKCDYTCKNGPNFPKNEKIICDVESFSVCQSRLLDCDSFTNGPAMQYWCAASCKRYLKEKNTENEAVAYINRHNIKTVNKNLYGTRCWLTLNKEGNDRILTVSSPHCKEDISDITLQFIGRNLVDLSGVYGENMIEFTELKDDVNSLKIKGVFKTESNMFWYVKSNFNIAMEFFYEYGEDAYTFKNVKITISGSYVADDHVIEVFVIKNSEREIYDIRKFDTVNDVQLNMQSSVLNKIQPGVSSPSFIGQSSYIKAAAIDEMMWSGFTGFGQFDRAGIFSLIISSKQDEQFAKTTFRATSHLIIKGPLAADASSFALLTRLESTDIEIFWKDVSTRDDQDVTTLGRINRDDTWCLLVSSSVFNIESSSSLKDEYKDTFKGCYPEENQDVIRTESAMYNFDQGTTFRAQVEPDVQLLGCTSGEIPSSHVYGEKILMKGSLGKTGVTWTYPYTAEVSISRFFHCLAFYVSEVKLNRGSSIATVNPSIPSFLIGTKVIINDLFINQRKGYIAASILYEVPRNLQTVIHPVLPKLEISSVQLSYEYRFPNNPELTMMITTKMNNEVPMIITMTVDGSSWGLNFLVPAMTFNELVTTIGFNIPSHILSLEKGHHLLETQINNLFFDLQMGDGNKLMRVGGEIILGTLAHLKLELVYEGGNGLAVGCFAPTVNFGDIISTMMNQVNIEVSIPWLNSMTAMMVVNTMRKNEIEVKFEDTNLNAVEMKKGLSFMIQWTRQAQSNELCRSNDICQLIYKALAAGDSITFQGQLQDEKLKVEVILDKTIYLYEEKLWFANVGFFIEIDFDKRVDHSVGFSCMLKFRHEKHGIFEFTGSAIATTLGEITLAFTFKGKHENLFECPQLTALYLKLEATVALKTWSLAFAIGARVRIGSDSDHMIVEGLLKIDFSNPAASAVYARSDQAFTIGNIGRYFNYDVADAIKDFGFPNGFTVSYSLTDMEFDGQTVGAGFYFKGDFNFLIFIGSADINIDWENGRFFVNATLEPVNLLNGFLTVTGYENEQKGPELLFDFDKNNPLEFKAKINSQIKLGATITGTELEVDFEKFLFKQRYRFLRLEVQIYFMDLSKPPNFNFHFDEETSLKEELKSSILDKAAGVSNLLTSTLDELQELRDKFNAHEGNFMSISAYFDQLKEMENWANSIKGVLQEGASCVEDCFDYVDCANRGFWGKTKCYLYKALQMAATPNCLRKCVFITAVKGAGETIGVLITNLKKLIGIIGAYLQIDFKGASKLITEVSDDVTEKTKEFFDAADVDVLINTLDLSASYRHDTKTLDFHGNIDVAFKFSNVFDEPLQLKTHVSLNIPITAFSSPSAFVVELIVDALLEMIDNKGYATPYKQSAKEELLELKGKVDIEKLNFIVTEILMVQFENDFFAKYKKEADAILQDLETVKTTMGKEKKENEKRQCIPGICTKYGNTTNGYGEFVN